MGDTDYSNRKPKRHDDDKRHNEITDARSKYLKQFQITPFELNAQDKQMKRIQKQFVDLSHRPPLKIREIVQVKILNGISPKELFVMKTSDESHANEFYSDIHRDYDENRHELMFSFKIGAFCVAKSAKNGWQRCRISRVHTKCACTVFLLDIGQSEHIKWINLRMLDERWCALHPFAIRCSLVDVTLANPIDRCTPQQQQQFTQTLQMYSNFYISVNRSCSIASEIFLYYVRDNQFHCVNEMFPSDLSSSDDDAEEIEESILSNSGTKNASTAATAAAATAPATVAGQSGMRSAGTTFIMNERLAKQLERSAKSTKGSPKSLANETTKPDENENQMKKGSPTNDIEMEYASRHVISKPLDQQRLTKPEEVIVRHIDEIGSVFVCFKKYKTILDSLRVEIQKQIRGGPKNGGPSDDDILSWTVGDFCLVYGKFEGFPEWLRGKITDISSLTANDGDRLARVYLRDVGKTVEMPLGKLKSIHPDTDESVRNTRDCIWKMRLAYIEINRSLCGGQIAKILRKATISFEKNAISILDPPSGDQFDAILWGVNRDVQALLPEKIKLTNINEELVKRGHANALAHTKFNRFNESIGNLMNPSYDSDDVHTNNSANVQSSYVVNDARMDVIDWLPPEPILQHEFVAVPTHVNQKCVLSILEAKRFNVAEKIKQILEKKYNINALERRDPTDWKQGDPCFARFPVDRLFYRGSVRRVNFEKNFCMIRFIDYGNCVACSFDDLRKATMFGKIPVLPRLYELDNIRPVNENELWPDNVREYCSETVVEKQCHLIVTDDAPATKSPDEPILCKLEIFNHNHDLASELVSLGMAEWIL